MHQLCPIGIEVYKSAMQGNGELMSMTLVTNEYYTLKSIIKVKSYTLSNEAMETWFHFKSIQWKPMNASIAFIQGGKKIQWNAVSDAYIWGGKN